MHMKIRLPNVGHFGQVSTFLTVPVISPDSKVHGANTGPIWSRQDPGGSHVGPMNFAIWK